VALPIDAVDKGKPVRVISAAVATVVVYSDYILPGMRASGGVEARQEECDQTSGSHEISADISSRNERW
jgi:hypothetical protein